jgi:hypothetical protein
MRVMVRNRSTGFWLRCDGNWTDLAAQAQDFGSSMTALERAVATGVKELAVILSFGRPELDVVIDLDAGLLVRGGHEGYRPRV